MNDKFIYRLGSTTNILGRPPSFYRSDVLVSSGCNFASIYAIREEDAHAIRQAGTAAGFKGIVWSQKLWVDIDSSEGAVEAQKWLDNEGYGYVVYDTGHRGCHIGINRTATPSHLLPLQDKAFVSANLPAADLSLYWHLHLLRLPGTVHEKTGKKKTLIKEVEGKTLVLPLYRGSMEAGERSDLCSTSERQSIFTTWTVTQNLTEGQGSRHEQLVNLAVALKRDCAVSADEAMWVVAEVNRGFSDPKGRDEVERIVKWVYA